MFSCSPVFCIQWHPTLFIYIFLSFYLLSFCLLIFLSKVQFFTCGLSPRLSRVADNPVNISVSLLFIFLSFFLLIFLYFYLMSSCSPVVCLLDCLQSRPISLKHFRQPQHSPTLPYFGFHQVYFLRRTKCPKYKSWLKSNFVLMFLQVPKDQPENVWKVYFLCDHDPSGWQYSRATKFYKQPNVIFCYRFIFFFDWCFTRMRNS